MLQNFCESPKKQKKFQKFLCQEPRENCRERLTIGKRDLIITKPHSFPSKQLNNLVNIFIIHKSKSIVTLFC